MPPASYRRTHGPPPSTIVTVFRYLLLGWLPEAIARETFVGITTIREWQYNVMRYGSVAKPKTTKNSQKLLIFNVLL